MTPTSTLTILVQSFRALARRWPVTLSLYGVTLFIVLPVVLAFRATLATAFDMSPVADRMFGGFDHVTYDDFMLHQRGAVQFFQRTFGPFIMVSLVLHGIFGAGVIAAVAGDGTAAEFLRGTGRFLGRSFRLVLYALVTSVVVLGLWTFVLGLVWVGLTDGATTESAYLTAAIFMAALFLFPVAILSLGTEYGRVLLVRDDRRDVLRSFFQGFGFVFRHPLRMIVQHGLLFGMMVLLIGCYWLIDGEVGMTTVLGVLVMFVVQQVSVVARIVVRVWHTASAIALVDAITPEVPVDAVAAEVAAPAGPPVLTVSTPPAAPPTAPLPATPAKRAVRRRATPSPVRKRAPKAAAKTARRPRS